MENHKQSSDELEVQKAKQQAVEEIIELLTPIVKKIESSLETTKGHYGSYAALLSEAKGPQERKVLAACLIKAGANKEGIVWALKFT